jgi:hypothetical protein
MAINPASFLYVYIKIRFPFPITYTKFGHPKYRGKAFFRNKLICRPTLREERRMKVFENRVLRRVFGPKRDEVTGNGENYIMRSLMICTPYPVLCGW